MEISEEKKISINSNEIVENKKTEEFQIIKDNIVYNFKINLDDFNTINFSISFISKESFKIYEFNPEQNKEIGMLDNPQVIYQEIINEIKDEKFEIIQQDDIEDFILLKLIVNKETREIKLSSTSVNDKIKLDALTKNYISLQKNYIELKEKMKNMEQQNQLINHEISFERNHIYYNSDSGDDSIHYNLNSFHITTNTNYSNPDENHILLEMHSSIWCMLKLNKITYIENDNNIDLEQVAIGFSSGRIIFINLSTLKINQEIKEADTIYSLTQFKDDPNYLISGLENGNLIIYKLNVDKFEQIQILEKPKEIQFIGEINKVITLSDGNLATAERGALSIWKPKIEDGIKKFEFFKELITGNDTCQLLEVNPQIFACAIHRSKLIKVYKNNGEEFPLLGDIEEVESHGSNSNGMAKINDNFFCSGGQNGFIYIVSVNPLQITQKIVLEEDSSYVHFLHNSNDGFIFTSLGDEIIQYRIINDEDNNFIKLEKFEVIEDGENNNAIITTDDGKIFYHQESQDDKLNLGLFKYKQNHIE